MKSFMTFTASSRFKALAASGLLFVASCGLPSVGGDATCGKDGVICTKGTVAEDSFAGPEQILEGFFAFDLKGKIIEGTATVAISPISGMHRDYSFGPGLVSDTDALRFSDIDSEDLPTGYRRIPNFHDVDEDDVVPNDEAIDKDILTSQAPADPSSLAACGTDTLLGSISAMIEDCDTKWEGSKLGNSSEGDWALVRRSKTSGVYEIWKDLGTGLIWSDTLDTVSDWCRASGNNASQCQGLQTIPPTSLCTEVASGYAALSAADLRAKGGLGLSSTPKIVWRLPTRADWMQADFNGIRRAVPSLYGPGSSPLNLAIADNATLHFWTATVYSSSPNVWVFTELGQLFSSTFEGIDRDLNGTTEAGGYTRCVGEEVSN
jgi:hypothetical protein